MEEAFFFFDSPNTAIFVSLSRLKNLASPRVFFYQEGYILCSNL
jgi:hypothetical protein